MVDISENLGKAGVLPALPLITPLPGEGVAYLSGQRFGVKSNSLNNAAF